MTAAGTARRPVLLGLAVAVVAAHLWLLTAARAPSQLRGGPRLAVFSTRSIDPPAPAAAAGQQARRGGDRGPAAPPAPRGVPVAPVAVGDQGAGPVEASARPVGGAPSGEPGRAPVRFSVPPPVELRYEVTARVRQQHSQGTSQLHWRHDGQGYEATFQTSVPLLPARLQHSAGRLAGEGLSPLRFAEKSRGEQATHFDREAQRVSFSNNRPATALQVGAQDRLSVLLQLGAMLAGAPQNHPPGSSVAIQTASTREAEPWIFTVHGEEQLDLPAGSVPAIKLVRLPQREFDQLVELWLAPGLDYVPVRLRLTQPNGDWVDHQWSATDRR